MQWRWDTGAALATIVLSVGYGWAWRRSARDALTIKHAWCFGIGIVLWLGPLIAVDYYAGIGRQWGPSMRIVGDVLGVGFIASSGLWWESDPQLRDRMGRR
jgi:hypothetical protein